MNFTTNLTQFLQEDEELFSKYDDTKEKEQVKFISLKDLIDWPKQEFTDGEHEGFNNTQNLKTKRLTQY